MPKHKSNIIPFRRIAAIAACLVLVFSFATSANAFSFRDVWNAVVTWAQETFSFSMGVEVSEPLPYDNNEYSSFQDALEKSKVPIPIPTFIPDSYELSEILVDQNPLQETYLAVYTNGKQRLKISIQSYISDKPEQVEVSTNYKEIYNKNNVDYYLFSNHTHNQAVWISGNYECYISGELSIEELKLMIDSIEKS